MNANDRLNLKKMINEMDFEDNTENIRKLKHSVLIKKDIETLEALKKTNINMRKVDPVAFDALCQGECLFLFNNYTDIYNKILKDEIDLTIMSNLLLVLGQIENGELDQNEGSFKVGNILKNLYVDSAIRRGNNIDKEYESNRVQPINGKKITWKQYKNMTV